MSPFVIALILCSSLMHVGWNLLARRERSEAIFYHRMLLVTALIGFVPGVVSEALTHSLTLEAWICVAFSGLCSGAYFFWLARSYEFSDFTVVYPIARSLPVLLVGLGDVLRGRYVTPIGWAGMLLVVCGCVVVPLRSIGDFALHRYFNRANLWMLLTALGTVGYTLLDKIASEVVQQGPATAARYGYIFALFSYGAYVLFLRLFRRGRQGSSSVGWRIPVLAAVVHFASYWLVLWAYQLSQHASYILAFRQVSIVIGVILGFAIYKEQGRAIRLGGAFVLTSGLVLIALWGG